MESDLSPLKRRALAPLDANALAPSPNTAAKHTSPVKAAGLTPKRLLEAPPSPAAKKMCLERDEDAARSRSHSPDTSSLFDTSTGDASWATVATEPDVEAAALTRPRPVPGLTRDQARQKAEVLRLRLGLASYKLRTGQTTVPLADLQVKPLPARPRPAPPAVVTSCPEEEHETGSPEQKDGKEEGGDEDEKEPEHDGPDNGALLLPHLRRDDDAMAVTPQKRRLQDEGRLTSSALRGGAASGLLSLARGDASDE